MSYNFGVCSIEFRKDVAGRSRCLQEFDVLKRQVSAKGAAQFVEELRYLAQIPVNADHIQFVVDGKIEVHLIPISGGKEGYAILAYPHYEDCIYILGFQFFEGHFSAIETAQREVVVAFGLASPTIERVR